jgi:hypothetical protein
MRDQIALSRLAHLRPFLHTSSSEWAVGNTVTEKAWISNQYESHPLEINCCLLSTRLLLGEVPPTMFLLLQSLQRIFEKVFDVSTAQFSLHVNTVPDEEFLCWRYKDHALAMELVATMNHNVDLKNLIACDPEVHHMNKLYLITWESIVMHLCFGASCLCFLCASFLLLEALVIFGLRRCREKLQAWNLFVKSKHRRF